MAPVGGPSFGPLPFLEMPPRRRVISRASREGRAAQRRALGCLRDLSVRPGTAKRYFKAVHLFLHFLALHLYVFPCTYAELDTLLCHYLEFLWADGQPKLYAQDVLSGMSHYLPALRGHYKGAWRLLGSWAKAEMPQRAPPFPQEIVYALAHWAAQQGYADMALLLVLGFHTYARSGELFACRVTDLTLDPASCLGTWSLPTSKSAERLGTQEILTITDSWIGLAILAFVSRGPRRLLVSAVSAQKQRQRLAEGLRSLGLPSCFSWYSVRRGGATHDWQRRRPLSEVQVRGRWSSQRTARIYLDEGLAQLKTLELQPAHLRQLLARARRLRPGL